MNTYESKQNTWKAIADSLDTSDQTKAVAQNTVDVINNMIENARAEYNAVRDNNLKFADLLREINDNVLNQYIV